MHFLKPLDFNSVKLGLFRNFFYDVNTCFHGRKISSLYVCFDQIARKIMQNTQGIVLKNTHNVKSNVIVL
jgi:hypothetical protein